MHVVRKIFGLEIEKEFVKKPTVLAAKREYYRRLAKIPLDTLDLCTAKAHVWSQEIIEHRAPTRTATLLMLAVNMLKVET